MQLEKVMDSGYLDVVGIFFEYLIMLVKLSIFVISICTPCQAESIYQCAWPTKKKYFP